MSGPPFEQKHRDDGLAAAIRAAGGLSAFARLIGRNKAGVSRWRRLPAELAADAERLTGVPRDVLRPDLFGEDHPT